MMGFEAFRPRGGRGDNGGVGTRDDIQRMIEHEETRLGAESENG